MRTSATSSVDATVSWRCPGEGPFGVVFVEVAGAGLLLIGLDHGGPCEILVGGRAKIVADPFEASCIASALIYLCAVRSEERNELRATAFVTATTRFVAADLGPRRLVRIGRVLSRA